MKSAGRLISGDEDKKSKIDVAGVACRADTSTSPVDGDCEPISNFSPFTVVHAEWYVRPGSSMLELPSPSQYAADPRRIRWRVGRLKDERLCATVLANI